MANIGPLLQQIANGVYGEDVRDAIHDAIEAINNDLPNTTNITQEVISAREPIEDFSIAGSLSRRLEIDYDHLKEYTDEKSAPGEAAKIQINNATTGYSSLKDRLDTEYNSLNSKYNRIKDQEIIFEDLGKTGHVVLRLGGNS